ncbi:MAG TPA: ATP-binding protein, partial [Labilithrix sp.]
DSDRSVKPTERDNIFSLVDAIRDYAIFLVDAQGRVRTWNEGARLIKGWTRDEIVGQPISRFYTQEDAASGRPEQLLAVAAREGRVQDEGWRVRKDGTRFWADVVITALRDEHGELTGYVKVTRDLTARRDAEELLRESEERLRHMLAQHRLAEQELAVRATQQSAVAELGLYALQAVRVEELLHHALTVVQTTLGTDIVDLVGVGDDGSLVRDGSIGWKTPPPPEALGIVRHTLETGEAVVAPDLPNERRFAVVEQDLRSAATAVMHGTGSASPIRGVLVTFTRTPRTFEREDIDFLHAVVNVVATALARSRTQEALRERDEFISIAAHELRTPLTALHLKLESARHGLASEPVDVGKIATRIDGAIRQAMRLGGLVERLLDVSRIVSGRMELRRELVDLAALVRRVTDDVREQALRAGCDLLVAVPTSLVAFCDPARVEQVVSNLLSNAIKYGAGKPIDVALTRVADGACVTVLDRGIGIDPADAERIFARFERAAPARHYGGLGLGLYISRRILEAHGGTIRVDSAPGRGSTFSAELPLEGSESEEKQKEEAKR